jgi:conjugative relaxase-like TrwC/TraI family protein
MLTISKPLSSGQAQSYHKLEFTSETQNYYKQGDSVRGEWQGQLAARLGVSGEVSPLEFSRLAEGKNPTTNEQMVRHRAAMEYKNADGTTTKSVEHRAGWDATFSAPKSISLTALVGGDDRVREAHRAAVTTALEELERYTQARIGSNHPAENTGKFIAAKFEHDTARPVDGYAAPQLHTHAVIFNVTERADGTTRAVQPQGLFDTQNFATAVYQSELTYRLTRLGYEIEPGRSGAPEIKGYSQEYLDASSPRSRQIKEQLEKTGYSGPEAAQIAAHSTRDRKQPLTAAEVLSAHRDMAVSFGDQPQQVIAAARVRAVEQQAERMTSAREAVTFARDKIFEREAVADERMILRDALRRGMGETVYRDIRVEFDQRREAGDFSFVGGKTHSSGRSFTTPETIAAERANIRYVLEGRNAVEPIMSAESAREHAGTKTFLNDTQRRVIEQVLNSGDRIHGLQGLAGSGKTSSLQSIREGAESAGYKVEGFAPTSKAAGQLREAGIEATTLQSLLARGQNGSSTEPPTRHLYMLDESSLASTKQMRSFLGRLGPNDRVLVIGDTRQHQGVDAGRPFQQMQEAGMQTSKLDKIMRQKDADLLKAVQHLANGETVQGIALLAEQGRVTEISNGRDRIAAIAKDYAAHPKNTIIVSPDNRSRQQINEAVRVELRRNGTLAEDGARSRTLLHRSDMTGADRKWAARYEPGNVLQYTTGSKSAGIVRDDFATVRSVDTRKNLLTVDVDNGSSVTYDPRRLQGVNVFREVEREFTVGDRIQVTAPNKDLGVANRDLGTITGMLDGQIAMRMDGKEARSVTFDPREFRQFDHGYAVTSHSSQGLTAGRVLAHIDTDSARGLINDRLAYVAISRASDDARIYTNNAETLGQRLSTDISKTSALELSEPGMSISSTTSITSKLGSAAAAITKVPEIEMEGFGLGL